MTSLSSLLVFLLILSDGESHLQEQESSKLGLTGSYFSTGSFDDMPINEGMHTSGNVSFSALARKDGPLMRSSHRSQQNIPKDAYLLVLPPRYLNGTLDDLSEGLRSNVEAMQKLNPDWVFHVVNKAKCSECVKYNMPEKYRRCAFSVLEDMQAGDHIASLCKACALYGNGGAGMDVDMQFTKPLEELIAPQDTLVLTWQTSGLGQTFTASVPKSLFWVSWFDKFQQGCADRSEFEDAFKGYARSLVEAADRSLLETGMNRMAKNGKFFPAVYSKFVAKCRSATKIPVFPSHNEFPVCGEQVRMYQEVNMREASNTSTKLYSSVDASVLDKAFTPHRHTSLLEFGLFSYDGKSHIGYTRYDHCRTSGCEDGGNADDDPKKRILAGRKKSPVISRSNLDHYLEPDPQNEASEHDNSKSSILAGRKISRATSRSNLDHYLDERDPQNEASERDDSKNKILEMRKRSQAMSRRNLDHYLDEQDPLK